MSVCAVHMLLDINNVVTSQQDTNILTVQSKVTGTHRVTIAFVAYPGHRQQEAEHHLHQCFDLAQSMSACIMYMQNNVSLLVMLK